MKKRMLSFFAVLLFILLPVRQAQAAEVSGYVFDQCGLLTEEERSELERSAETISETYDCGIYIAVVEDYRDYSTESVHEAAKAFFNQNRLGVGESGDGFMLMLSMDERDYWMLGHGDYGNYVFTDYGRDDLETYFLDNFREDDWYGGFTDYLNRCGEMLEAARDGSPISEERVPGTSTLVTALTALVMGFLLALVLSLLIRRVMMRSVYAASTAGNYIPQGGVSIRRKQDRFTHQTVSRVHIERDHGGPGADSGGFSGSGGKF